MVMQLPRLGPRPQPLPQAGAEGLAHAAGGPPAPVPRSVALRRGGVVRDGAAETGPLEGEFTLPEDASGRAPAEMIALPTPRAGTGRLLAAYLPLLRRGRPLYCLDGGNVFDPYQLATQARALGLPPGPLLERVFISRAYTCHQLAEAARTLLLPLGERQGAGAGTKAVATGSQTPAVAAPLVALLGIDRLFLDEDIPLWERRHLFGELMRAAERLRQMGVPTLVTFVGPATSPWVRRIAETALLIPGADAPPPLAAPRVARPASHLSE